MSENKRTPQVYPLRSSRPDGAPEVDPPKRTRRVGVRSSGPDPAGLPVGGGLLDGVADHVAARADLDWPVDEALVVAVPAVDRVLPVAVLGVEEVVAAVAVEDIAVRPEGRGVDAVAVAQAAYVVGDAVAAALVEGVAAVGAEAWEP